MNWIIEFYDEIIRDMFMYMYVFFLSIDRKSSQRTIYSVPNRKSVSMSCDSTFVFKTTL